MNFEADLNSSIHHSYFQWSWVLFDAFSGNRALAITYSKPVTAGINCRKRGGVKTWFSKQATAIQKHPTAEINIFKINFSNLKTNCLALIEFFVGIFGALHSPFLRFAMNAFSVAYHHEQNLSITVLFSLDRESSHLVLVGYSSTKSLNSSFDHSKW